MSKTLTCNTELFKHILTYCTASGIIFENKTVVVGFSGGPDSLFLLHFFLWLQQHCQLKLIAAHLDHQWRERSVQDAHWCKTMAEQLGVPIILGKGSDILLEKRSYGSQEDAGRRKRRLFFEKIAQQYQNAIIALGHHLDDQQETFFVRLLRGAGITGLAGIKPLNGLYCHPLLDCTKQELINWLTVHALPFLTDETNEHELYLRNRIRLKVIPALRQCDDRFNHSLRRTMNNIREADDFLQALIKEHYAACTYSENGVDYLNVPVFLTHPTFLQKQILLCWVIANNVRFTPSLGFFNEIMRFFTNSRNKKHVVYASWSIIKHNEYVYIKKEE